MKKAIAILLSLALLLGCAAAVAESAPEKENLGAVTVNGAFNLRCAMPEGYRLTVSNILSTSLLATITSADPEKPILVLSIAFDETYANVERMNDLDDEALAYLEGTFTDEYDVDISYGETAYGTKLLIVREVGDKTDYVDILSVYKGYFIEFVMTPNPAAANQTLTEAQIQMCIDFLSEVDFVPA